VSFRTCRRGEIYDLDSTTRSTCSVCQNGYSFADNTDNQITSCEPCPPAAESCQGDTINLYPGTWRWNDMATTVFHCPLESSCTGGNRTGASACAAGFYGPTCGACSPGYENSGKSCFNCAQIELSLSPQFIAVCCFLGLAVIIGLSYTIRKLCTMSQENLTARPTYTLENCN
jgi:hypothetical protein